VRWHQHSEVQQIYHLFRDFRQGLEKRLNFGGWGFGNCNDIEGNMLLYQCDGRKRRRDGETKSLPKLRKYNNKLMSNTSGPFMKQRR